VGTDGRTRAKGIAVAAVIYVFAVLSTRAREGCRTVVVGGRGIVAAYLSANPLARLVLGRGRLRAAAAAAVTTTTCARLSDGTLSPSGTLLTFRRLFLPPPPGHRHNVDGNDESDTTAADRKRVESVFDHRNRQRNVVVRHSAGDGWQSASSRSDGRFSHDSRGPGRSTVTSTDVRP